MHADLAALTSVIDRHMDTLAKPGVLSVRPGYKVKTDWLTDTPAIVVTVVQKANVASDQVLPTEIDGVPVDVRQASTEKRLEIEAPATYAKQLRVAPDLGSVPHFADERTATGERPAATASAHAALARSAASKPRLDYTPADGVTLDLIEADTTIHVSASPDSGWTMLKGFLAGTNESLTVGLYDFTSAHVLTAVKASLAGKDLTLVLDHPAKNPTADQTDADTVADLRTSLGAGFDQVWALSRTDPDVDAWIFPSAYHIKVAVRDHAAVWLSSGNWNNSNQPDIDPQSNAADAQISRHRDRDWHIIVEEPALANAFEQFIVHDKAVAAAHNNPPEAPGDPLPAPRPGSTETPPFTQFFAPATITDQIKIHPLLTPDPGVYVAAIKDLINSATRSLHMQFQYIELPSATATDAQPFTDLIQAVIDQQAHVDVKIIMSEFEKIGYLEQLQTIGLDVVNKVKIQKNVHNKGIIVDGSAVLVSSQNWSADGTLFNRDAGVIVYNAAAAAYFEQVFLHDWANLAKQQAMSD